MLHTTHVGAFGVDTDVDVDDDDDDDEDGGGGGGIFLVFSVLPTKSTTPSPVLLTPTAVFALLVDAAETEANMEGVGVSLLPLES